MKTLPTASKISQGKRNRINGKGFENKVRENLEKDGWIVSKWQNNVVFTKSLDKMDKEFVYSGKLVPCKPKYNPFLKRVMMFSGGVPDFIAFKKEMLGRGCEVIGVESKSNGSLSPEEKEKFNWYLEQNIFSRILVAKRVKIKNKVSIVYTEYKI